MFQELRNRFFKFITSRVFIMVTIVVAMAFILIHRLFVLQIVNGQDYLDKFQLKIKKERTVPATRANIYDRNGVLLAYNELAYSITLEDVYESGREKNALLNETIHNILAIIEKHGDSLSLSFHIRVNENDEYEFTVSDAALLRFLADIYGYASVNSLKYAEKTASAQDVMDHLTSSRRYSVSDKYSKQETLEIVTVRYALAANSYQKYIATTIAKDVNESTVADILENSDVLPGVNVAEDTVRRYTNSVYFSNILGYTGSISQAELAAYREINSNYTSNDMVGKTGIEQSQELVLQGVKGVETVYVDNLGRVIEISDRVDPEPGQDVYLTIDADLQIAVYHILEQKIAGILVSKIDNIKEFEAGSTSQSKIRIPIYDVYIALFENNVIKMKNLSSEDAGETAHKVYSDFENKLASVLADLRKDLLEGSLSYSKLAKEKQAYHTYLVQALSSANVGIIDTSLIDTSDKTYIAWKSEETISMKTYLNYCISQNWINVKRLELEDAYADSSEIYERMVDNILDRLSKDPEFHKIVIRYMIKNSKLTGKQICMLLYEEGIVNIDRDDYVSLSNGKMSAYQFMLNRISNLDITPAQLALDPCSGSVVITDPNTGDVLALVTYPSYDNNKMANQINAAYYSEVLNDKARPLWNYATQQTTAPGSTFKMVTASAALEEGVIRVKDTVKCVGTYDRLSPTIYKCWISPGHHNDINVTTALAKSCNFFFYEMGYRLSTIGTAYDSNAGLAMLEKYADLFGLTETSGVEIPESQPHVSDMYSVVSAIGQGTNDYTTIGLARYVSAVANSGTVYNLTLIDKTKNPKTGMETENHAEVRNVIAFKDSTWRVLHEGMRQVVENKAYYRNLNLEVAGKTGTAQESTLRATHALFVSYAPYENPMITVTVRIAFGYSSDYAAETAKSVYEYYFRLNDDVVNGRADEMESAGHTQD